MDMPYIFDKSIYMNIINKNKKLSNKQKKCMNKIIYYSYDILFCLIHENIIFCIGRTGFSRLCHFIYIINEEYFISICLTYYDFINKYAKYGEIASKADYTFRTIDNELLFTIMCGVITAYGTDTACSDVLIKYSERTNIISLFRDRNCFDKKIGETIKKNVINELMNANVIIDYSLRDKIFKLLHDAFISNGYNYNEDEILNHIFGFIPKAMQFSFVD